MPTVGFNDTDTFRFLKNKKEKSIASSKLEH